MKKKVNSLELVMVVIFFSLASAACDTGGGGGGGGGTNNQVPNHAPVIVSAPIVSAIAGDLYLYQFSATDADGDTMIYSVEIGPSGMAIDVDSGLVSWLPGDTQVGDHQVKLKATDGKKEVFQDYTLNVSLPPQNHAPIIISDPVTVATLNDLYNYDVEATDQENDGLAYSLLDAPIGMTIGSTSGLIAWTPGVGTVGNHWISVEVNDGETSDYQFYAIRVVPSDNGVPFQRGCNLTSWWYTDYQQLKTKQTVDKMKADGCEYISILVTQYQDTISSTTIYPIFSKTPTDDGLAQIITYAHSLGIKVALKPHVDVQSGAWRGEITFTLETDWQAWFASYETFLDHYLDLAETNNVELFIIGTEFSATEQRETDWRAVIADARSRFSGLLTYAANHDSYFNVNWWDDLDFIGVDAYFPLTSSYSPTVNELISAWTPWKNDLSTFAATWNMDIVFTEIGYQSLNGTNISPWWVSTSVVDLQEQADCYQAALTAVFDEPWFKGMYYWMWYWDPDQDVNDFDVYNKPAEDILRYWYAGY